MTYPARLVVVAHPVSRRRYMTYPARLVVVALPVLLADLGARRRHDARVRLDTRVQRQNVLQKIMIPSYQPKH